MLQLKLYAQYKDPRITDEYSAKAFEDSKKDQVFTAAFRNSADIRLYVSVLIGSPVFLLILTLIYVMGARWQIQKQLNSDSPTVHASLAATTVTGILCSLYVLVMDGFALSHAVSDNEFEHTKASHHSLHNVPLLWITVVTFVIDAFFVLLGLNIFLVSICGGYIMVLNEADSQRAALEIKKQRLWLMTLVIIAPIGCIGTHLGYIIIAWLSLPHNAANVFFFYMLSLVVYFFTFRQLYLACINSTRKSWKFRELNLKFWEWPEADEAKSMEFQYWIVVVEVVVGIVLGGLQAWFTLGLVLLNINDIATNAKDYISISTSTILAIIAALISYKVLVIHPKQDPNASFYKKLLETTKYIKGNTTGTAPTSGAEDNAPTRVAEDNATTRAEDNATTPDEDNAPVPTCDSDTERAGALLGVFIANFTSEDGNERERIKKVYEEVLRDHAILQTNPQTLLQTNPQTLLQTRETNPPDTTANQRDYGSCRDTARPDGDRELLINSADSEV